MRSIHIKASREYDVLVERGLLDRAGELLREVSAPGMAAIVSDDTVYALYGERTVKALEKAGYRVHSFTFPAGEGSKNLSTYADVLHFLGEHRFSRSDVVVALGGGVVGDLAGFAAATYQRGMGFAQIPTTLLAAVDSSVGGKTAIDMDGVKNIVGAFHQPRAVLIDTDTLRSLPPRQMAAGLAESVKMAVTCDAALLALIENSADLTADLPEIIARSLAIKARVVEQDPTEQGLRRVLNFGHTIGHAIESCAGGELLHGECVALGMLPMIESKALQKRVRAVYRRLGLPVRTTYNKEKVLAEMLHDKKAQGGQITVIKVPGLGCWRAETIPVEGLRTLLGMED